MATLRSTSARWFWFLLLTAIVTTTATETITETTTANSKAAPPILALEKSSVLSIKLEAAAVVSKPINESGNESGNESELVESFAKSKGKPSDARSFPGIYTAKYTYTNQSSESVSDTKNAIINNNIRSWLQEFDVIRFECNSNGNSDKDVSDDFVNTRDNDKKKNNTTNNLRGESNSIISCKGHLLISSEDEYRNIASAIRSEPSSVAFSNYPPFLRSLEYDSTLTESWVHPRMKVVAENALLAGRRLENENENKAKPSLREAGGKSRNLSESRDRYDDLFRNDNYGYSTIKTYPCYYDYQGTMKWIEDFVAEHTNSSLLEVTWKDIGDSWKKRKSEGLGGDEGYDIHVLTITRKPKVATVEEASASTSTTFQRADGDNEDDNKAPFLIVSSTHAREYTPPVLVRLWLEHLVEKVLVECLLGWFV